MKTINAFPYLAAEQIRWDKLKACNFVTAGKTMADACSDLSMLGRGPHKQQAHLSSGPGGEGTNRKPSSSQLQNAR